ncbi:hypothetical protein CTZ27_11375 [Streptomyces griseocarneus]|nr:hypothetical protein CTZ27_11375 [Streptomyces griseocarneus]
MFIWWGRTVARVRWLVLVAASGVAIIGLTWGTGVFGTLVHGGFEDPHSESARVWRELAAGPGGDRPDLLVLYSSRAFTVESPQFRIPVTAALSTLRRHSEVAGVVSYYDSGNSALVSRNRHATYAAVRLGAPDQERKVRSFLALRDETAAPGVTARTGGPVAFDAAADAMTGHDVERAEWLATPVVLVLLMFVFGGLVAACVPVLVGAFAVLGALAATRLLATAVDISVFAVNSIVMLGLGMAIDYSLLMIGRFRDELRTGHDPRQAMARTMATAGRTVFVSGVTVVLALAGLLVFPEVFLRSTALGGMTAVLMAVVGALTLLPGVLLIVGRRVDALRVPVPYADASKGSRRGLPGQGAWARLAHGVMRHPVRHLCAVVVVLAALTLPFLHVRFGGADERVVPADTPARVVSERIAAEFPRAGAAAPIDVLVDGGSAAQIRNVADRIREVPGVAGATVTAAGGRSTHVSVGCAGEAIGERAHKAVRAIRGLPLPTGVAVRVGGRPAEDVDRLADLGRRLPWMAAVVVAATSVLFFLAFGSVVLPVKAVAMNLVSIGASFGVLVWVFQDGHLAAWLGFTPTGVLEPTVPVLVFAVLFGLATDYEIFLLARVREAWEATGDTRMSVATGLQRTGGVITAAALLLLVVVAGFTTGDIVFTKLLGVGMITAVVVDATLVRMLLAPAAMQLLGRWNWWAPAPLARVHRRLGVHRSCPEGA